jgi:hypothetical protein
MKRLVASRLSIMRIQLHLIGFYFRLPTQLLTLYLARASRAACGELDAQIPVYPNTD